MSKPARGTRRLLAGAAVLTVWLPASAAASPVLVVRGDRAVVVEDPFVPSAEPLGTATRDPLALPAQPLGPATRDLLAPPTQRLGPDAPVRPRTAGAAATGRSPTVVEVLDQALAAGAIDAPRHDYWRGVYEDAVQTWRRSRGRCRLQLARVIQQLERFAGDGRLTPSRMPVLFLQLARNAEFWGAARSIAANGRVRFGGSPVLFEHVPGQGLQFHPLGNFGALNAMVNACLGRFGPQVRCPRRMLREAVDALERIASRRDAALTWEYFFLYAGGRPPWVSAMAQATGIQAFAKSAAFLGRPALMQVAAQAIPLFEMPPPNGVRVGAPGGAAYLHYSFAPRTRVLNASLQTLIGLLEYAQRSGDPRAYALFRDGDRALRRILPRFDTGRWSRYELGGPEAPYGYHQLVVDFLGTLCRQTGRSAYCRYGRRFGRYLRARREPGGGGGRGRMPRCGVV